LQKALSIRNQFLFIGLSVLVLVSACFVIYYNRVSKVVINRSQEYTSAYFSQVQRQVNAKCDLFQKQLLMVAYNPAVLEYLQEDDPSVRYELSRSILPLLGRTATFNEGVIDIAIVGNNRIWLSMASGGVFLRDNDIQFPNRGQVYFTEKMTFSSSDWQADVIVIGTNVFSVDLGSFGDNLGRAAIIADVDSIPWIDSLQSEGTSTRFYLLDRDGKVFASDESDRLAENPEILGLAGIGADEPVPVTIDGTRYIAQVSALDHIDGRIVGLTPVSELLSDVIMIRTIMIIVLSIAIVLITLLLVIVARNILVPITGVTAFINRIKNEDIRGIQDRLEVGGYTEIITMAEELNSMLDQISELTERLIAANTRLYETELVKKHTEVAMLQSQINPHFLYNTLESVKGMALETGATKVVDMTKALGRIFKYAVRAAEVVSLAEELEILKAYIFIQQIRFRDRFTANHSVSEHALSCMIPKMILQPLVENAVTHGLEMKKHGGRIEIAAVIAEDGALKIRVADNGEGIAAEELERLQVDLRESENAADIRTMGNRPIGLRNVQSRIQLLYGDGHGVTIESERGKGTTVSIRLPAQAGLNV
jgi:two-component system, sensor histidine kinase YesM